MRYSRHPALMIAGQHRLVTLGGLLIALTLAVVAARGWPRDIHLLADPYPLDYGEGVVLSQALWAGAGNALYPASDRTGPDFVGSNYPPLFYLIVLFLPRLADNPYTGARAVSFASYLAVAALAGAAVGRSARDAPAGLLTGAAFLASPPAREWGILAKPDLLALALSTAGLALATLRPRSVGWVAALFALALLTKQTTIAAPAAVVLSGMLVPGRRRHALAIAGLTGLLVIGPLALLAFAGQDVVWHLVVINARGWQRGLFATFGLPFLALEWPLLAAAVLGLVLTWRRRPVSPIALYIPLALLTLLAAGAPGASRNYALEASLGLALAGGLALATARRAGSGAGSVRRAAPALAIVGLLGWQAVSLATLPDGAYGRPPPTAEYQAGQRQIVTFLQATTGEVYSEDVGLLLAAGRTVRYHDPSLLRLLMQQGRWDGQPLLDRIRRRQFAALLLKVDGERRPAQLDGWWTPEAGAAIRANYRVLYRDIHTVYGPR